MGPMMSQISLHTSARVGQGWVLASPERHVGVVVEERSCSPHHTTSGTGRSGRSGRRCAGSPASRADHPVPSLPTGRRASGGPSHHHRGRARPPVRRAQDHSSRLIAPFLPARPSRAGGRVRCPEVPRGCDPSRNNIARGGNSARMPLADDSGQGAEHALVAEPQQPLDRDRMPPRPRTGQRMLIHDQDCPAVAPGQQFNRYPRGSQPSRGEFQLQAPPGSTIRTVVMSS